MRTGEGDQKLKEDFVSFLVLAARLGREHHTTDLVNLDCLK